MTPWRNGGASDSRAEGCEFESRRGQKYFVLWRVKVERNVSGLIQIEMKGFFPFKIEIYILFIVVLSPELKYEESKENIVASNED